MTFSPISSVDRSGGLELLRGIFPVGHHDGHDLVGVAGNVGGANAVIGLGDGDDLCLGGQTNLENVVHTHQLFRQGSVDFHDDHVSGSDSCVRRTAGSSQVQAVFGDSGTFNQCHIGVQTAVLLHVHGQVGNVQIAELDRRHC